MNIGSKGRLGEEAVVKYLREKGYIIVKRNYSTRFGEIDVIAENETHIIFTEVKFRSEDAFVSGAEAVDAFKQRRLRATAADFLSKLHLELQPRFDVAEVTESVENGQRKLKLKYMEDAF
ncbi:MAG: YraN family protein [Clostridia bacterium]|nr:YraN family protein [Clostridia bacterium]